MSNSALLDGDAYTLDDSVFTVFFRVVFSFEAYTEEFSEALPEFKGGSFGLSGTVTKTACTP